MPIDREPIDKLLEGIAQQKAEWEATERARAKSTFEGLKNACLEHKDLLDGLSTEQPSISITELTVSRWGESIDQAIEYIRVEGPLHFPERKN